VASARTPRRRAQPDRPRRPARSPTEPRSTSCRKVPAG
jgi:hypothetical protein